MRQGSYEHWGGMLEGKKCFSVFREYSGTEYSVVKGCPPKHEPPHLSVWSVGLPGPAFRSFPGGSRWGPRAPGTGGEPVSGMESSRVD